MVYGDRQEARPLPSLTPGLPLPLIPVAPLTAQCPHSYLHSCDPPIIHGNLTCDTIFIQHNGLIKIGSGEGRERFWAGSLGSLGPTGVR